MRIVKSMLAILSVLSILFVVGGLYLSIRHPFVYNELYTIASMVISKPKFEKPDDSIKTLPALDRFIVAQLDSADIPGAAVAIVANGKVEWSKGYGYANVERQMTTTADTPFMLGSISKSVTGVTMMHAVEDGLLDLDEDINTYLPFRVVNPLNSAEPITLRHLATHTSGISDDDWNYTNSYTSAGDAQGLNAFLRNYLLEDGELFRPKRNFLNITPGETYEYSNIATGLAGEIVSEAVGMPMDQYSSANLFKPLGMYNTAWFLSDLTDSSTIAQPYVRNNKPIDHYEYPTWPEGQLRSSANDLARLLSAIMNKGELDGKRILSEASVAQMLERQTFPGLVTESGEGIFWSYTKSGLVGHNGGDFGVITFMLFDPETEIGVVVLSNAPMQRGISPIANIARQIVQGAGTADMFASQE